MTAARTVTRRLLTRRDMDQGDETRLVFMSEEVLVRFCGDSGTKYKEYASF